MITVNIPGSFTAHYDNGQITKWVFMPDGSYAGYFGPLATIVDNDNEIDDDDEGIDVGNVDGPFWKTVQLHLAAMKGRLPVHWEE